MLQGAIAMVPEQQVCGRVVLLVIGRDLAAHAASDGLATPAERQAARVFGGYIRTKLRRNLDLLDGNSTVASSATVAAVRSYLAGCDGDARARGIRRRASAVPVGAV